MRTPEQQTVDAISARDKEGYYHTAQTTYEEGSEAIRDFLRKRAPYDTLVPFPVTHVKDSNARYSIYFGYEGGEHMWASVNDECHDAVQEQPLLAIPNQDSQNRYTWLEVCSTTSLEDVQASNSLLSLRLNQDSGTIEKLGWRGPEIQSFVEFMMGDSDIAAEDLVPFSAQVQLKKRHQR